LYNIDFVVEIPLTRRLNNQSSLKFDSGSKSNIVKKRKKFTKRLDAVRDIDIESSLRRYFDLSTENLFFILNEASSLGAFKTQALHFLLLVFCPNPTFYDTILLGTSDCEVEAQAVHFAIAPGGRCQV